MANLPKRVISGKGIYQLDHSTDDIKKAKIITLYVDVIRHPTSEYLNLAYNPGRGRFATLNFFKDGYLLESHPLEFPKQQFRWYPEPSAQTLYAVECSYAGVLQTFFNLGNALALPSISLVDNIKDWNHTDLFWDVCKIVCYADTALQVYVGTSAFDLCPDQTSKQPDPPPPPPVDPPPPNVPKGSPLGSGTNPPVSSPYTGEDDGGDTVPFPGDSDVPPTPPPLVQKYNVIVFWYASNALDNGRTTNGVVWGSVLGVRAYFDGSVSHLQIQCYGSGSEPQTTSPVYVDIESPSPYPDHFGTTNQPYIVSQTPV